MNVWYRNLGDPPIRRKMAAFGKSEEHNPRRNDGRKSDKTIVVMKQANKTAKVIVAETVERRVLAKGNPLVELETGTQRPVESEGWHMDILVLHEDSEC